MSHYNYGIINGANESAPKLGAYYTRALPELILVVDDQVEEYDDSALQEEVDDIM